MVESGVHGATDAVALIFGSLFGVGLLAAFMRRWWKQQDNAFVADQNARAEERANCDDQIRLLRAEHTAAIAQLREQHVTDMSELRDSFQRKLSGFAVALKACIDLIPEDDERRAEATRILLQLSVDEREL